MIDRFKKFFSAEADSTVAEATQPENGESMTTTKEQPELTAEDNTAELAAQLAAQSAALEDLQVKFAELNSKYEQATEALAKVESDKEDLVAKAAEARMTARKEKLENAVGSEKASTLLSSLDVLDDAAFDAVVSSMSVNLDKEQKSAMFTEVGVTTEAAEVKPAHFKDYIKTK